MPKWNTGSRIEEIDLLLITNKSKIFQNQHDHIKVMQLVDERCKLEVEKAIIKLRMPS